MFKVIGLLAAASLTLAANVAAGQEFHHFMHKDHSHRIARRRLNGGEHAHFHGEDAQARRLARAQRRAARKAIAGEDFGEEIMSRRDRRQLKKKALKGALGLFKKIRSGEEVHRLLKRSARKAVPAHHADHAHHAHGEEDLKAVRKAQRANRIAARKAVRGEETVGEEVLSRKQRRQNRKKAVKAALGLFKKIRNGEETQRVIRRTGVKALAHKLHTKLSHAHGEEVARPLKRAAKTGKVARRIAGEDALGNVNKPLKAFTGEDALSRKDKRKQAKDAKKAVKAPAALGLYELSNLLNLNDN